MGRRTSPRQGRPKLHRQDRRAPTIKVENPRWKSILTLPETGSWTRRHLQWNQTSLPDRGHRARPCLCAPAGRVTRANSEKEPTRQQECRRRCSLSDSRRMRSLNGACHGGVTFGKEPGAQVFEMHRNREEVLSMGPIKSLWASIQGDPKFMRAVNGWLTIFWIAMIPVSIVTGWVSSVQYVSALSLWALVSGHWSAWQAARGRGRATTRSRCTRGTPDRGASRRTPRRGDDHRTQQWVIRRRR